MAAALSSDAATLPAQELSGSQSFYFGGCMSEWRSVDGYEGKYEVSAAGEVRKVRGEILGQWFNSGGYCLVRLSQPRKTYRVHRLVAKAFVENPHNLPYVNHLNFDTSCNIASNLEWCTQWQNLNHSEKAGRMQRDYWVGKRSPSAKLDDATVVKIRVEYRARIVSWQALANKYKISKRSVGRILSGETYV